MLVRDLRKGDKVIFRGDSYTVKDDELINDMPYVGQSEWINSLNIDDDLRKFLKTDEDRDNGFPMHKGQIIVKRLQYVEIYNSNNE